MTDSRHLLQPVSLNALFERSSADTGTRRALDFLNGHPVRATESGYRRR
jgi:hypothetical protein